jgi:hypothetical protein
MLGLMAKLSAEDPPKFFRVLAAISKYIHQRFQSPEFVAALRLWSWADRPDILGMAREDLSAAIKRVEEVTMTAKVVHKALKRARDTGLLQTESFHPKRIKFRG